MTHPHPGDRRQLTGRTPQRSLGGRVQIPPPLPGIGKRSGDLGAVPPFVSSQPAVEQTQRRMYRAVLRPRPGSSTKNQPEGRLEEPAPEECVTAAKAIAARVSSLRCSEYARTDAEDFS